MYIRNLYTLKYKWIVHLLLFGFVHLDLDLKSVHNFLSLHLNIGFIRYVFILLYTCYTYYFPRIQSFGWSSLSWPVYTWTANVSSGHSSCIPQFGNISDTSMNSCGCLSSAYQHTVIISTYLLTHLYKNCPFF